MKTTFQQVLITQSLLNAWFDDLKPWQGEQAKDERFVWLARYGMPLNAWNDLSFRALGSNWGQFIQLDDRTLRGISFEKGRILIATEIPKKIEEVIQVTVEGTNYMVRVEEEESFRSVESNMFPLSSVSAGAGEEDDDVGGPNHDMDKNKTVGNNLVDDKGQEGNVEADKDVINAYMCSGKWN